MVALLFATIVVDSLRRDVNVNDNDSTVMAAAEKYIQNADGIMKLIWEIQRTHIPTRMYLALGCEVVMGKIMDANKKWHSFLILFPFVVDQHGRKGSFSAMQPRNREHITFH